MGQYERAETQRHTPDAIFPAKDVPYIVQQHESGHRYRHNRNEFYLPRKDGAKIPSIFSGRVIQGPDGREYVILILTDISAQKRVPWTVVMSTPFRLSTEGFTSYGECHRIAKAARSNFYYAFFLLPSVMLPTRTLIMTTISKEVPRPPAQICFRVRESGDMPACGQHPPKSSR